MRTRATARYIRVPASKARLVLDHIRGKSVGEALATLQFTPKAAGRLIEKVLRSAIANAEHNHQVRDLDDLRVVKAIADGGPRMKRVSPRAMGRAYFIKHRTSHLTIELSDETPASPPRREEARGSHGPEDASDRVPAGVQRGRGARAGSPPRATRRSCTRTTRSAASSSRALPRGDLADRHRALGQPSADHDLHRAARHHHRPQGRRGREARRTRSSRAPPRRSTSTSRRWSIPSWTRSWWPRTWPCSSRSAWPSAGR